jgi:hypothetical protein
LFSLRVVVLLAYADEVASLSVASPWKLVPNSAVGPWFPFLFKSATGC